jgi:PAS domain S-box-containing protein
LVDEIVPATLRGGWQGELVSRRGDGTEFPIFLTTSAVRGDNGQPLALVGAITDISRRKRTEEALRQSETLFRSLAETMPVAIYTHQGGPFTYVNAAAVQAYGYAKEELLGINFWELADPESQAEVKEQGLARLRGEPVPARFEVRNIAKDGTERWRDVTACLMEIGGRRSTLVTSIDITDRKRAEEALRRQAIILDQIHDSVIATDLSGCVTSWNKGAERLFGYSAQEVIGRHISFICFDEDRARREAEVVAPVLAHGSHEIELRRRTKSGTGIHVHLSLSLLRNAAGAPIGIIGYSMDITERKRAEDALRRAHAQLEDRVRERTAALLEANENLKHEIAERRRVEAALRASEEHYRAFIANSSEGIYRSEFDEPIPTTAPADEQAMRCHRDSYVAECNDVQAQMYGYSRASEFVGTRPRDVRLQFNPEAGRRFVLSGYRLTDVETNEVDRFGRTRCFLNNEVGIVENGFLVRIWGTQRDITDQKRMARAQPARRHQERLFAHQGFRARRSPAFRLCEPNPEGDRPHRRDRASDVPPLPAGTRSGYGLPH